MISEPDDTASLRTAPRFEDEAMRDDQFGDDTLVDEEPS